jgi:hypothetical protein
MSSQVVVIPCPHCGRVQSQSISPSQGTYKACSNQYGGCGKTYYVQTNYKNMIERVDR